MSIAAALCCRQLDHEASAKDAALGVPAVLDADDPMVGLDDLLGDGEAEAAVGAEFLAHGPLGIEAVEDCFELTLWNAGTFVLDGDTDEITVALGGNADRTAGWTEGDRVGDEIAEHLAKPA